MDDLKKLHRQFITTFVLFISLFVSIVIVAALIRIILTDFNVYVIVVFFTIISLIVISTYYQAKLSRITNLSYLLRIMGNSAEPLKINHMTSEKELREKLLSDDFLLFKSNENVSVYYKTEHDLSKSLFKRYILDIVLHFDKSVDGFYNDKADDFINDLTQELLKKKIKINRMLVTQVKEIDALDERIKAQIKEIAFHRTKKEVISIINIGIHLNSNNAVLLYSDTYSPSIYYKHHIELIKSIV